MEEQKKQISENCILVGSKNFMAYLKGVNTLFRGKNLREIEIKARGNNIKKAVDIVESSKNKFCHDLKIKIKDIKLNTETFQKDGKEISVSSISIILIRE